MPTPERSRRRARRPAPCPAGPGSVSAEEEAPPMAKKYRALVGFNYPAPGKPPLGQAETEEDREGIRVEAGDVIEGPVAEMAHFLGECGPGCTVPDEKPESPHGW